ncbi:MAG: pyruvate formate-lyase-activating protein [Sporolactobacillus sp.]
MATGRIHSVESFGTVDGPGIRYVVFMQGCALRCQYCHNVDTRDVHGGREVTVDQLINELNDYLPFIQASKGGITVSGGEPLMQLPFLIELFQACKALGVHTAIDTSGFCPIDASSFRASFSELVKVTDLILLDMKEINPEQHRKLTGVDNRPILAFARLLSDAHLPVWIRHVLVPGYTDSEQDLGALGAFINSLDNIERVEILPYHKMGIYKWEALGMNYPLKDVQPPTAQQVERAYLLLKEQITRPIVAVTD